MREPRRRSPRGMEQAIDRARRFRWRIRILTGGFILLFSALALQAISLMAFSGDDRLKKLAERQHNQVVALYPKRGTLYDRNEVPLALSVDSDSVYADPKFVQDPSATADALAPYLKLKREELLQRLQQSQRFVWLERRLGPNEAVAIRKLKLKGIHTVTENRRFYPNRELGGALLGFTNIDDIGIEGSSARWRAALTAKSPSTCACATPKAATSIPKAYSFSRTKTAAASCSPSTVIYSIWPSRPSTGTSPSSTPKTAS